MQDRRQAPIMVNDEPLDRSRDYGSDRPVGGQGRRNGGENPFFAALNFARDIDDSRHEATIVELRARMDALRLPDGAPDFKSKQNVLWRLVKATVENEELPRVLDEQAVLLEKRHALKGEETLSPADAERLDKVSGRANAITAPVFAVAWVVKMGYVAHLAKALGWALAHTQATVGEKFTAGILDTRGQPGHEVRVYIVRPEALTKFAATLRARGDARAAEILEIALRRNQESVKAGRERRELAELARLKAAREAAEDEADAKASALEDQGAGSSSADIAAAESHVDPADPESGTDHADDAFGGRTETDPEPESDNADGVGDYSGEMEANPA